MGKLIKTIPLKVSSHIPVEAGVIYPDTDTENENKKTKVHPIIWAIGIVGGLLVIERLLPGGRTRVASLINPAGVPISPRGRAYRKLVTKHGVIKAGAIWRAMPESQKPKPFTKHIYVSENPCGRGRYKNNR